MMDTIEQDDRPTSIPRKFARFIGLTLAGMMVVSGLAIGAAGITILIEKADLTARIAGTLFLGAALAAAGGVWLHRLKPLASWSGPMAQSERKTRIALIISALLGGAIGLGIVFGGGAFATFSNAPIDPVTGIAVTAAYVILTPIAAIFWHRNADEFERGIYAEGAMIALYVYSFVTPGWWMLNRAGVLPPQDPMIVFMVVITVWGLAWIARKSN